MADIRAITTEIDLSNPPGPEAPMRQGTRWGPVDTAWPENKLNASPDFGSDFPSDDGGGIWWSLYQEEGPFPGDLEAWGTLTGGQFGVAGEGWRIGLWNPLSLGGGNTAQGYVGLVFHALGDANIIRRYDAPDNFTTLISGGGGSPPWNNKLLLRRVGSDIEMWSDDGTGLNWSLRVSATDNTYPGPLMFGFASEDPTHGGLGWTGVGGGKKTKTRIIRYVSN